MSHRRHFVIGTAGHIDHGKSLLVRALTGTDPDRLPEEKARGITIDLGFAVTDLGDDLRLAFVDVPGHERFVKNMLAGVGGIDAVLLVVAADESVMPQTREHLEICGLLGIGRGVVALTKIDLVPPDLRELAELEVREFLENSFLREASVVPVSGRTSEGVDALRAELRAALEGAPPRNLDGPPRLSVDRAFSVRGFGTVITGTLLSGRLAPGAEVMLYPECRPARVRRVEVHGSDVPEARAGERVALNLQGVDVSEVPRGTVVSAMGHLRPSRLLDARLHILPSSPAPLRDLARVRFHQGTAEVIARVKLLGTAEAAPGEEVFGQVRLERAVAVLPGDTFILRRYSPSRTIGGGAVVDAAPAKHRGASREVVRRLETLQSLPEESRFLLLVEEAARGGIRASDLAGRVGLEGVALLRRLDQASEDGLLVRVGEGERAIFLEPGQWATMRRECQDLLTTYHREHPLEPGPTKEELRVRILRDAPLELFRHLLQELERDRLVVSDGDRLRSADHRMDLSGEDAALREKLEDRFRDGGLNPPDPEEVLAATGDRRERANALMRLLLRQGTLVRIRGGAVFHAQALAELRKRVLQFRHQSEKMDVGAFKELTGTTRKNAIPLLEYLDGERVTRRVGNDRLILLPSSSPTSPDADGA